MLNAADITVQCEETIKKAEKSKNEIHEGQLSLKYGFLPSSPLPDKLPEDFQLWDELAALLPLMLRTFNERIILKQMPMLDANKLGDKYLARAAVILGAFAHAFYFNEKDQSITELPSCIFEPWKIVCKRLGRHTTGRNNFDTFLCNWKMIKQGNELHQLLIDDFELLVPLFNNIEEKIFNLTIFISELRFSLAITNIINLIKAIQNKNDEIIIDSLQKLIAIMERITVELQSINPNKYSAHYVDPVIWTKTVARIDEAILKDVKGVSGNLSPLFHVMEVLLETPQFYEAQFRKELQEKRMLLSQSHREFVDSLERDLKTSSLKSYVENTNNSKLKCLYNQLYESYLGEHGWFNKHRIKVYGYAKLNFRAGRLSTNGGQKGTATIATEPANNLNANFQNAMKERENGKLSICPFANIKRVNHLSDNTSEILLETGLSGLDFQPGDRCAIYPKNTELVVQQFMQKNNISDNTFDLNNFFNEYLAAIWNVRCLHLPLSDFLRYINLVDLQIAIDNKTIYSTLIEIAKPITPRLYSVSPLARDYQAKDQIRLTVCQYTSNTNNLFYGVCSSFLRKTQNGESIAIRKVSAPRFRLPQDSNVPILMFAGGTGIAPFIGFIEERMRSNNNSQNWLFYSVKSKEEYYYADKLENYQTDGRLTLHTAITRNNSGKQLRINQIIEENAEKIYELFFENNAYIYVCGRSCFSKSIKEALQHVFKKYSKNKEQDIEKLMSTAYANGRYNEDTFTSDSQCNHHKLNITEVSKHNKMDDCWVIIKNKVYDITPLLATHEGGHKILFIHAGADATTDFFAIDHHNDPQIKAKLIEYERGTPQFLSLDDKHKGYFNVYRELLYALLEMRSTLINNSSFNQQVTPLYLWINIYEVWLQGPFIHFTSTLVPKLAECLGDKQDISFSYTRLNYFNHKLKSTIKNTMQNIDIKNRYSSSQIEVQELEIIERYKKIIQQIIGFIDKLLNHIRSALQHIEEKQNDLDYLTLKECYANVNKEIGHYIAGVGDFNSFAALQSASIKPQNDNHMQYLYSHNKYSPGSMMNNEQQRVEKMKLIVQCPFFSHKISLSTQDDSKSSIEAPSQINNHHKGTK